MITTPRIANGLLRILQHLAHDYTAPAGWDAAEWAYVKGLATGATLQAYGRLPGLLVGLTPGCDCIAGGNPDTE